MPAIGVDIGGTSVKFGVVTTEGEVIAREACPSPKDWQAMAALIAGKVTCLRSEHPGPVGICTAGTIGPDGQVTANQLGWNEVPLGAALQAALGEQVPLIHDGHSALMAESVSGALKGMRNGLLVQLGTGIGGGFLSNGQPYVGRANVAPEIGHIITHADGLPCSCGQIGCWEAYASASALSQSDRPIRAGGALAHSRRRASGYLAGLCAGGGHRADEPDRAAFARSCGHWRRHAAGRAVRAGRYQARPDRVARLPAVL
jgi:glucokinase